MHSIHQNFQIKSLEEQTQHDTNYIQILEQDHEHMITLF